MAIGRSGYRPRVVTTQMKGRVPVLLATSLLGLAACASAPGSPEPSVVPIILREAPDIGCDAVPSPWKFFVIRIDALAEDQVWAVNDQAGRMNTFWEKGFTGGTSAVPVVVDPEGQVVARDGERIDVPQRDWPDLHGHFVCPGLNEIYILLAPFPD
jgi:hypothetical protein